jgi:serine protease AprX
LKKIGLGVVLLFVMAFNVQAQRVYKYAVFFTDKDTLLHHPSNPATFLSQKAIARKQKQQIAIDWLDLPVNPHYVEQIVADTSFTVNGTSKWFNCAVVFTSNRENMSKLVGKSWVSKVVDVGYSSRRKKALSNIDLDDMIASVEKKFSKRNTTRNDTNVYGLAWQQATINNIPALHEQGMQGQEATIAVIDAGFSKANSLAVFEHSIKQVLSTYDFVDRENNVFDDDDHGTAVWSCMAANDSFRMVGTAPLASYVLLRSEDAATEFPVEEFYWTMAAEMADSIGVDIISSSLGYNEFADPQYSYTNKQLNGKSSWITQAATMAVAKGMLVVNSAGNEGDNMWQQITFPADADEVITVGSVDKNKKMSDFSSIGLTADKRIKPNVVAQGESVTLASDLDNLYTGNGTSYSCPILAGGLACLWPLFSDLSAQQIKALLELSSSNYNHPDKYKGYGIPDLLLTQKLVGPFKTDSIIDVRMLEDGNMHITLFAKDKRTLQVVFVNESHQTTIHQQNLNIDKTGVQRVKLKRHKKLKADTYKVLFKYQNQIIYETLITISEYENN